MLLSYRLWANLTMELQQWYWYVVCTHHELVFNHSSCCTLHILVSSLLCRGQCQCLLFSFHPRIIFFKSFTNFKIIWSIFKDISAKRNIWWFFGKQNIRNRNRFSSFPHLTPFSSGPPPPPTTIYFFVS